EPFLLASSITGVLGMRLIRRNCPVCLEPYRPDPAVLSSVPAEMRETAQFQRGGGCPACNHTGFNGRSTVMETLKVDETLRDAVLQKLPTRRLQELAQTQGMETLWQAGLRRALRGETTLEEILRVVGMEGF
ncbi:MAG: type secretion system protein GspE, partial [Verrucomicrobiota bacterium]